MIHIILKSLYFPDGFPHLLSLKGRQRVLTIVEVLRQWIVKMDMFIVAGG